MSQNNKVLYITNTIAEYRVCFFEQLSSTIDVTFLITHPDMANKIYGSDGSNNSLNVINLRGNLFDRIKEIKREILNGGYNKIVLPPADSIKEIVEGYVSLHFAKKTDAEIFTWTEKWEPEKKYQPIKKRIKNRVQRIAYGHYAKNATRCIVFGVKSKEYIQSVGASNSKIRIAHMTSIPPEEMNLYSIREKHDINSNNKLKVVFCLARMIPRKGIEVLIDAMAELNKTYDDIVLLLGGDGPLEEIIRTQVERYKLNNVVFVGRIPPNERSTYYAQSDVFVLPSRIVDGVIEGWGLPVNESLYCGTPVVATTAVGSAYDMLDGNNGIIVDQSNSSEMAKAIENILYKANKETMKRAIEQTNNAYSISVMTTGFVEALNH